MREEVSRKIACSGRQKRYDWCRRLRHRGLMVLLNVGWQGKDVRRDRRCGEGCTKLLLEVYRMLKNLRRELLKGQISSEERQTRGRITKKRI